MVGNELANNQNPLWTSIFWRLLRQDRQAAVSTVVLGIFLFAAIFAAFVSPLDPAKTTNDTFQPPSSQFLLGTDDLGRDVLSGIIYGAQTSIIFGVLVTLTSGLIGIAIGGIAGYAGGIVDDFLMRLTEFVLIPPRFFLALVMAALFGTSLFYLVIILSFTYWTTMARLVRAEVMSLKERSFVEAAKAGGSTPLRIFVFHILPNALPVIITQMMLTVGGVILLQAALDFIGIGDADRISWGSMLHNGQHFIRDGWWMVLFPSLALALLVLALNILGDTINFVLNPKTRSSQIDRAV
ncbi:MAG: ABC transporter permease [Pyrinomonadaceae bacterium]